MRNPRFGALPVELSIEVGGVQRRSRAVAEHSAKDTVSLAGVGNHIGLKADDLQVFTTSVDAVDRRTAIFVLTQPGECSIQSIVIM